MERKVTPRAFHGNASVLLGVCIGPTLDQQVIWSHVFYVCLVCLPASVLFFCVHEEPPAVLPVDEWLERENNKKQCCKPLRRYLRSKKKATWVWCQHTCCSASVNLQEETEKSTEEIAFEEENAFETSGTHGGQSYVQSNVDVVRNGGRTGTHHTLGVSCFPDQIKSKYHVGHGHHQDGQQTG